MNVTDQTGSDPVRTPLFRTESGALYAQDAHGLIYRDGELLYGGPLIAIDAPESPDRKPAVGCRVFLLIDAETRFGWRITTQVVELFAEPVVPDLQGLHWDSTELLADLWRSGQRLRSPREPRRS